MRNANGKREVRDRNELRRLARRVYDAKRAEGKSASLSWAEVIEIANKAVEPLAMDDMARETAQRIVEADTRRSQS